MILNFAAAKQYSIRVEKIFGAVNLVLVPQSRRLCKSLKGALGAHKSLLYWFRFGTLFFTEGAVKR